MKEVIYERIDTDKVKEIIKETKTYFEKDIDKEIKELETQKNSISFIDINKLDKNTLKNEDVVMAIENENAQRELMIGEINDKIKHKKEKLNKLKEAK